MQSLLVFKENRQSSHLKKGLRYEGINADVSHDEEDAIIKILNNSYETVVIKNTPPLIEAFSLCKKIKKLSEKTIVFIFDPNFEKTKREKLFDSGVNAILTPPLSFETLVASIKEISGNSLKKQTEEKQLANSHLRLDLETREAFREKRQVKLRNKEFNLLEFFMRSPGKILNRNTILEYVWDHNADILTNTVDVHISSLRKKIDNGFKRKLIQTVHCVGYRLDID